MPSKKLNGLNGKTMEELFKSPEVKVDAKVSLDSFLKGCNNDLLDLDVFPAVLCKLINNYQKTIDSFEPTPTQCPEEYRVKLGLYRAILDTYNKLLEQKGIKPKYFPSR